MRAFAVRLLSGIHGAGNHDRRVRKGFIAVGRIEDYSAGVIFRHEQTLSGPKADRLELLRHTQTHTGRFHALQRSCGAHRRLAGAAARAKPEVEIRDEYDVVHKMWPVKNRGRLPACRTPLRPAACPPVHLAQRRRRPCPGRRMGWQQRPRPPPRLRQMPHRLRADRAPPH